MTRNIVDLHISKDKRHCFLLKPYSEWLLVQFCKFSKMWTMHWLIQNSKTHGDDDSKVQKIRTFFDSIIVRTFPTF